MVSSSPEPQPGSASVHRLNSWKEIAAFLGTTERTVQRWEKGESLPVHRHLHSKRGTVYAFDHELEEWRAGRHAQTEAAVRLPHPLWRRSSAVAAAITLLALAAVIWNTVGKRATPDSRIRTTPLTSYPGRERYSSFSPDGRQFAFSWKREGADNFDVYVRLTEAGEPQRRTSHAADELSPAWSPDGRWIAFVRVLPDKSAAILVMPSLGGAERQLAVTPIAPLNPILDGPHIAWSPDGKWIVIQDRNPKTAGAGFALVSVETGEKRWMLSAPPPATSVTAPAFSRDGRQLAFSGIIGFTVSEIYVAPLTEGLISEREPKRITFEKRLSTSPVWAPGGEQILFLSGHWGGETMLSRVAPMGGPVDPIGSAGDEPAVLSPIAGASRLAYTRNLFDTDILKLDLTGSRLPQTLASSTRVDINPQFSPDGKRVAFESSRNGTLEIWTCNSDGSNPMQLTSFGGPLTSAVRWSPDGRHVVFNSRPDGNADLFVIAAEGGQPRRLTRDPGNEELPSWSRDGRWIYFCSNRGGKSQVWKIPSAGGDAIQVTRGGGLAALESPDGKYIYYSKGRASGPASLWRLPASSNNSESEETQVLGSILDWSTFTVVEDGIWFIQQDGLAVRFFSFSSGETRTVATLEKPAAVGLTVSGSTLLLTQITHAGSDLMLVER